MFLYVSFPAGQFYMILLEQESIKVLCKVFRSDDKTSGNIVIGASILFTA